MSPRAPISVIIPTLNCASLLPETLTRIMEGVNGGFVRELIISDGGSTDDVKELADEVGAQFMTGPAGRVAQVARGCSAAQGTWLLIIDAETWLPEGWTREAAAHFSRPNQILVFSLQFRLDSFLARMKASWATLRTTLFSRPYTAQGLLISTDLFKQLDGPEAIKSEPDTLAHLVKGRVLLSPLCVQIGRQTDDW